MRLTTACRRLTKSLLTHTVHCSLRPIDTSSLVRSMRRPISPPAMITKQGFPAPLGRSDGSEIAVRRPGSIEVMTVRGIDSTPGGHGVKPRETCRKATCPRKRCYVLLLAVLPAARGGPWLCRRVARLEVAPRPRTREKKRAMAELSLSGAY